jgi:hypothetical protein
MPSVITKPKLYVTQTTAVGVSANGPIPAVATTIANGAHQEIKKESAEKPVLTMLTGQPGAAIPQTVLKPGMSQPSVHAQLAIHQQTVGHPVVTLPGSHTSTVQAQPQPITTLPQTISGQLLLQKPQKVAITQQQMQQQVQQQQLQQQQLVGGGQLQQAAQVPGNQLQVTAAPTASSPVTVKSESQDSGSSSAGATMPSGATTTKRPLEPETEGAEGETGNEAKRNKVEDEENVSN